MAEDREIAGEDRPKVYLEISENQADHRIVWTDLSGDHYPAPRSYLEDFRHEG